MATIQGSQSARPPIAAAISPYSPETMSASDQPIFERRDDERQRDHISDQPGRVADLERESRQTVGAAPCGQQDHPAIAQEERRDQSVE